MENRDDILDLIEKYEKNLLSDEERKAFDKLRAEDPEVEEKLTGFRLAMAEIAAAGRTQFEAIIAASIQSIKEREITRETYVRKRRLQIVVWIGSVAAIIVPLILFVINRNQESSLQDTKDLFAMSFEPYIFPNPRVRSSDNTSTISPNELLPSDKLWLQAKAYYDDSLYQATIPVLQEYLKDSTIQGRPRNEAYLYLGVSFLGNQQPDLAIKTFTKITDSDPGDYYPLSKWYIALSYLYKADLHQAGLYLAEYKGYKLNDFRDKLIILQSKMKHTIN